MRPESNGILVYLAATACLGLLVFLMYLSRGDGVLGVFYDSYSRILTTPAPILSPHKFFAAGPYPRSTSGATPNPRAGTPHSSSAPRRTRHRPDTAARTRRLARHSCRRRGAGGAANTAASAASVPRPLSHCPDPWFLCEGTRPQMYIHSASRE